MFGLGLRNRVTKFSNELRYFFRNHFSRPNLYSLSRAERVGVVYHQPSDMCVTDRLMLYALVRGLRPGRVLEIGARWGGSARIMTNAMEENSYGTMVGIDPVIAAFRARDRELHGRYKLIQGYSPQAIPEAMEALGGSVDLVFIDALHIHDAVLADFNGVLPYLSDGAHIVLHDTYHQGVDMAIGKVLREHEELVDLGFLTRNPEVGDPVLYQGLRLVRYGKVDSQKLIKEAYARSGRSKEPIFHEAVRNYDEFANKIGKGATKEEIAIIAGLRDSQKS